MESRGKQDESAHVERVNHGDIGDTIDPDLATNQPENLWERVKGRSAFSREEGPSGREGETERGEGTHVAIVLGEDDGVEGILVARINLVEAGVVFSLVMYLQQRGCSALAVEKEKITEGEVSELTLKLVFLISSSLAFLTSTNCAGVRRK